MLDYINDDLNENDGREDDILMHLEDLWNQSMFFFILDFVKFKYLIRFFRTSDYKQ